MTLKLIDWVRRESLSRFEKGREATAIISIGVAATLGPDDKPDALLKRADEEVYEAKAAGRNKVISCAA